jgi:disulfide bond formation protein DsbB
MQNKIRPLLFAIAFISFGLIGAALYLQHVVDLLPCPLCVIQRYAFLGIGIFALAGALGKRPLIWIGLALASGLGGLVTAGKHLYVLANPGFSCGIDPMETFLNKIPTATLMPWLFEADGLCERADDLIMGLNIPQWAAVWFVLLTSALVVLIIKGRKTA